MPPTANLSRLRTEFFSYLFGEQEGYICIGSSARSTGVFRQQFFKWPESRQQIDNYIRGKGDKHDLWFCTSLLEHPERTKSECLPGSLVWSDLDYVPNTDKIEPPPSCLVESSPGRYQAYWRLERQVPADVQEDFSRRVEYLNRPDGAHGGWDLTQLLRIPYTHNMKYSAPYPQVVIKFARDTLVPVGLFDELPDLELKQLDVNGDGMTNVEDLPDAASVIYSHRHQLTGVDGFAVLIGQEPDKDADWSKLLWRLINICVEAGMSKDETFAVALSAKCNKYARDNRPMSFLWREVLKASLNHDALTVLTRTGYKTLEMPDLVDLDKVTEDSLVKDYKEWGEIATDAPPQYHELSCFIALSALLSSGLSLKTSFGTLYPNLWGLVLGESTLTRKSTTMRMAMDIVTEIDEQAILATDGSPEGLLTGLSARPEQVSIFFRDEVSGFFDSINRKDYLAGLPETLTQLYDVPKILQRLLRKDTITIHSPYFIFFGGGIRDKIYSLVNEQYILSGFIPRFLVVSADNDRERWRATGPPTPKTDALKGKVFDQLVTLKEQYSLTAEFEVAGQIMNLPIRYEAHMKKDAWEYYGQLERLLVDSAADSPHTMVAMPTFQRMAFSMLKMAMLIGATRREPDRKNNTLEITKGDIVQGASYIQRWGVYMIDLVMNAGQSDAEKIFDKIISFVSTNQGCTKSTVMNQFHLSAKEIRDYLDTLTERGMLVVRRKGNATRLYTIV